MTCTTTMRAWVHENVAWSKAIGHLLKWLAPKMTPLDSDPQLLGYVPSTCLIFWTVVQNIVLEIIISEEFPDIFILKGLFFLQSFTCFGHYLLLDLKKKKKHLRCTTIELQGIKTKGLFVCIEYLEIRLISG